MDKPSRRMYKGVPIPMTTRILLLLLPFGLIHFGMGSLIQLATKQAPHKHPNHPMASFIKLYLEAMSRPTTSKIHSNNANVIGNHFLNHLASGINGDDSNNSKSYTALQQLHPFCTAIGSLLKQAGDVPFSVGEDLVKDRLCSIINDSIQSLTNNSNECDVVKYNEVFLETNLFNLSYVRELGLDFDDLRSQQTENTTFIVPHSVIDKELNAYFWLWSLHKGLLYLAACKNNDTVMGPPPEIWTQGWSSPTFYNITEQNINMDNPAFQEAILLMTMVSEQNNKRIFMLVCRGTDSNYEWQLDFQYNFAQHEETKEYFPGKVHQGFFKAFGENAKAIRDEMLEYKPDIVIVTGLSLGGALSRLYSHYLASSLQDNRTDSDSWIVTNVAFASPNTGDLEWVESYNKLVNSRQVKFKARRNNSLLVLDAFPDLPIPAYVGDPIAEIPCDFSPDFGWTDSAPTIFGCPDVLVPTGEHDDSYKYRDVAGLVFIYADQVVKPYTDEWQNITTLLSQEIINQQTASFDIGIKDVIQAIQDPLSLLNPGWDLSLNHVRSSGCITGSEIRLEMNLCNISIV